MKVIRGTTKVGEISKKVQEIEDQRYKGVRRNIMRGSPSGGCPISRKTGYITLEKVLNAPPPKEGQMWIDSIKHNLREKGLLETLEGCTIPGCLKANGHTGPQHQVAQMSLK